MEVVHGASMTSIEDAIAAAISSSQTQAEHKNGEVVKITLDIGGVRGGTEYHVEVRLT
jgi:flavin-binding protein dodecin